MHIFNGIFGSTWPHSCQIHFVNGEISSVRYFASAAGALELGDLLLYILRNCFTPVPLQYASQHLFYVNEVVCMYECGVMLLARKY